LTSVLPGSENGCIKQVTTKNDIGYFMGYADKEMTQFIGYAATVISKGYKNYRV
jgi:hypothetical protein